MNDEHDGASDSPGYGMPTENSCDANSTCQGEGEALVSATGSKCPDGIVGVEDINVDSYQTGTLEGAVITQMNSWSGPLPPYEEFAKYPKAVQQKIIEWNDVQIIDSSKREDALASCEIKTAKRGQLFSFLLNLSSLVASFTSFVVTDGNPISFVFMSIPAVTLVVNIAKSGKEE